MTCSNSRSLSSLLPFCYLYFTGKQGKDIVFSGSSFYLPKQVDMRTNFNLKDCDHRPSAFLVIPLLSFSSFCHHGLGSQRIVIRTNACSSMDFYSRKRTESWCFFSVSDSPSSHTSHVTCATYIRQILVNSLVSLYYFPSYVLLDQPNFLTSIRHKHL